MSCNFSYLRIRVFKDESKLLGIRFIKIFLERAKEFKSPSSDSDPPVISLPTGGHKQLLYIKNPWKTYVADFSRFLQNTLDELLRSSKPFAKPRSTLPYNNARPEVQSPPAQSKLTW